MVHRARVVRGEGLTCFRRRGSQRCLSGESGALDEPRKLTRRKSRKRLRGEPSDQRTKSSYFLFNLDLSYLNPKG